AAHPLHRAQAPARADRAAAGRRGRPRGAGPRRRGARALRPPPVTSPSLALGTRGSRLALAQAELAGDGLRRLGRAVAVVPISTLGDRDRRRGFAELGGRGVFVREIEEALLDGRVDVAVHSAKDLTGDDHPDLALAACLPRADARDA